MLGDVEEHNRLARERDEDLGQWVADDHLRLQRELRGITGRMAAPGPGKGSQLYSGAHARAWPTRKSKRSASGTVTVKERELLVWTIGF